MRFKFVGAENHNRLHCTTHGTSIFKSNAVRKKFLLLLDSWVKVGRCFEGVAGLWPATLSPKKKKKNTDFFVLLCLPRRRSRHSGRSTPAPLRLTFFFGGSLPTPPPSFLSGPGPPQTDILLGGGGPPPTPPSFLSAPASSPQTDIFWVPLPGVVLDIGEGQLS